jgi:hypothetical protein
MDKKMRIIIKSISAGVIVSLTVQFLSPGKFDVVEAMVVNIIYGLLFVVFFFMQNGAKGE